MIVREYVAMWSDKPNKKAKSYHDGFVRVFDTGEVRLISSDDNVIRSSVRLENFADGLQADTDYKTFPGYAVQVLELKSDTGPPLQPPLAPAPRPAVPSLAQRPGAYAAPRPAAAASAGPRPPLDRRGFTAPRFRAPPALPAAAVTAAQHPQPLIPTVGQRGEGRLAPEAPAPRDSLPRPPPQMDWGAFGGEEDDAELQGAPDLSLFPQEAVRRWGGSGGAGPGPGPGAGAALDRPTAPTPPPVPPHSSAPAWRPLAVPAPVHAAASRPVDAPLWVQRAPAPAPAPVQAAARERTPTAPAPPVRLPPTLSAPPLAMPPVSGSDDDEADLPLARWLGNRGGTAGPRPTPRPGGPPPGMLAPHPRPNPPIALPRGKQHPTPHGPSQPQPFPPYPAAAVNRGPAPPPSSLHAAPPSAPRPARPPAAFQAPRLTPPTFVSQGGGTGGGGSTPAPAPAPGPGPHTFLRWPTPEAAAAPPARTVALPCSFRSVLQYTESFTTALDEEIGLSLQEPAKRFYAAVQEVQRRVGGLPNGTLQQAKELERVLKQQGTLYSADMKLTVYRETGQREITAFFKKSGKAGAKKRPRCPSEEAEAEAEAAPEETSEPRLTYALQLVGGKERGHFYAKDDLWVISSGPFLSERAVGGGAGGRPWVMLARSLWHGPNQDGRFDIEPLGPHLPGLVGKKHAVFGLRAGNVATELAMQAALRQAAQLQSLRDPPSLQLAALLKTILGPTPAAAPAAAPRAPLSDRSLEDIDPVSALANEIAATFRLNEEQRCVLDQAAAWFAPPSAAAAAAAGPPICLIHGPFGSGKSTLLTAALHFFSRVHTALHARALQPPAVEPTVNARTSPGPDGSESESDGEGKAMAPEGKRRRKETEDRSEQAAPAPAAKKRRAQPKPPPALRVLVSAHTNVAVDRIMLGLQESGFNDFIRVGPLRRIDRHVLSHALHATDGKSKGDAAEELRQMLQDCGDPAERRLIQAELDSVRAGADKDRKKKLKSAAVVGVTCCSSGSQSLQSLAFDVVLLDECSQMVEPLSLLPVLRAKPRFLLAAGDPLQLPPVIANPPGLSPATGTPAAASTSSLARPLFVRLRDAGLRPTLLRRQYRCHPDISQVANTSFYEGRLLDGIAAVQRPPLVPALPALCFVETRGQEGYDRSRSCYNEEEARDVASIASFLLDRIGLAPDQIGIICFHRAQAQRVQAILQAQGRGVLAAAGGGGPEGAAAAAEREPARARPGLLTVATVDSYQGSEKDVILLSTTVTRPTGFIADPHRLNVALTRAKHHLIVLGAVQCLQGMAGAGADPKRAFERLLLRCQQVPGGWVGHRSFPPPAVRHAMAQGAARADAQNAWAEEAEVQVQGLGADPEGRPRAPLAPSRVVEESESEEGMVVQAVPMPGGSGPIAPRHRVSRARTFALLFPDDESEDADAKAEETALATLVDRATRGPRPASDLEPSCGRPISREAEDSMDVEGGGAELCRLQGTERESVEAPAQVAAMAQDQYPGGSSYSEQLAVFDRGPQLAMGGASACALHDCELESELPMDTLEFEL